VRLPRPGCRAAPPDPGPLASSAIASDFATYHIARVGTPAVQRARRRPDGALDLQRAFQLELSRA
jgi:hypothetical protein